jgi:hypothetical protein
MMTFSWIMRWQMCWIATKKRRRRILGQVSCGRKYCRIRRKGAGEYDKDLLEIPDWALSPLGGGTYACTIGMDENCIPAHHSCVHLAAAWSKAAWPDHYRGISSRIPDAAKFFWNSKLRETEFFCDAETGWDLGQKSTSFLGASQDIKSECGIGERDWDTCQLRGDFGSLNKLTFGYMEDDPGAVWLKDRSEDYMHGYTNDTHLKRPDVFPNL